MSERFCRIVGSVLVGAAICLVAGSSVAEGGASLEKRADDERKRYFRPSVLAACLEGPAKYRYSAENSRVDPLLSAISGAHTSRPRGKPVWRLTLWHGENPLRLEAWPGAAVIGAFPATGKAHFAKFPELETWLRDLPELATVPPHPKSPREPAVTNCGGPLENLDTVASLDGRAEYIAHGRVIGLVDNYYKEPASRRFQSSVYLLEVLSTVKIQPKRPIECVALHWPGGYLDGGEETPEAPLPRMGDEYIFLSSPWRRSIRKDDGKLAIQSGDHMLNWAPGTPIRVRNGITAPLDSRMPPEYRDKFRFLFPQLIPIYGQQVGPFLEFLRWGLRDENRGYAQKPIPATFGKSLRRLTIKSGL